jgi:hypothetical protein
LLRETGTPEYREQPYNQQCMMPFCPHEASWRDIYSGAAYGFLKAFSYHAYPVVYRFPEAAAISPLTTNGIALRLCLYGSIVSVVAIVR